MSFTSRAVLADAASLWRAERDLLVPLAGLFFVVPLLATVLLVAGLDLSEAKDPEKLRAALLAFYDANLPAFLAIGLAMDFGAFAIFNLYLQGGGRTLGEVLVTTLRRFPGFFVINLVAGLLFSIGLSLFVLPGMFALARTWIAGPAYAAEPAGGMIGAFRQGWLRSAGMSGFALLGIAAMVMFVALVLVIVESGILGGIAGLVGGTQIVLTISHLLAALIGGGAWAAIALLRVAAYRVSSPRQGI